MRRNKLELAGNLGQNPEVKNLESGKILATFSLAETSGYYDKDKVWQETVQWFNCEAWGKTAERIQKSITKGDNVFIDGRIKVNNYETKEGEKRTSVIIVVETIEKLNYSKNQE